MIHINQLLDPSSAYLAAPTTSPREAVYLHLAQPKRRALLRRIGLDEVSAHTLRAEYGRSWSTVQPDLRALVAGGLIEVTEREGRELFRVDLSAFPRLLAHELFQRSELPALRAA